MPLFRPNPTELPKEHERVFVERYAKIVTWALKLMHGDRAHAQDLSHDAFIQFTLSQPDLNTIQNLDSYLYTLLRNLHVSYLRRASRDALWSVSPGEFDSIYLALAVVDRATPVSVQNELRHICAFACQRKETSKSASILILRFFYDYLPKEIGDVALLNMSAVYNLLRNARMEIHRAKQIDWETMQEKPADVAEGGLSVIHPLPQIHAIPVDVLLAELRTMLLSARRGECLPAEELLALYQQTSPGPVECALLAHLVSCQRCLDLLNDLMKRPRIDQRVPGESMDTEQPRDAGNANEAKRSILHIAGKSNAPKGQKQRLFASGLRRREEIYQHRPAQLSIAVNGELQASQAIQSEASELKAHVDHSVHAEFVEVFSEQGLRLLLASIQDAPPQGPHERHFAVELSDGRSLELFLEFGSQGLSVVVRYRDPEVARIEAAQVEEKRDAIVFVPEHSLVRSRLTQPGLLPRLLRVLTQLVPSPGWVVATALSILAVVSVLFYAHRPVNRLNARDLLARAAIQEQHAVAGAHAEHRTLRIEQVAGNGTVVESGHTDMWHEDGKLARRFYDGQNHLLAGEWRDAQHSWTYNKIDGLKTQRDLATSTSPTPDDAWRVEPAADDFSRIVNHAESVQATQTEAEYRLEASLPARITTTAHLVRAVLVLTRKTLHAQSETLWFSNGESYRIVETSYDQPRMSDVGPDVFRPDTSLRHHGPPATMSPPGRASIDEPATIRLEIRVLAALNGIGADVGDSINVTRESSGEGRVVRVSGIVDTSMRKEQILAALTPLVPNPSLKISLFTPDEAGATPRHGHHVPPPTSIKVFDTTEGSIPAYDDLKSYFGRQGYQGQELENHIDAFCFSVLQQSSAAAQQAWAMKRLTDAFAPDELARLDDDSRVLWLRMLETHAREFNRNVTQLRTSMALIYPDVAISDNNNQPAAQGMEPETLSGLTAATQTIFNQAILDDETIRSAFSHNNSPERAAALRTTQFHTALAQTEQAAAAASMVTGKLENWASLHSSPQKRP